MSDDKKYVSDGSTASYYELPEQARELQDLISYRNMNAQDGEIFRAIYRKGLAKHSDALRDAKKVKFYADAEVERLEKLNQSEGVEPQFDPLSADPKAIATGVEVALMQLERDIKALMHRVWRLEVKTGNVKNSL